MSLIWHNGKFAPETEAVFLAHDRARIGQCVFNTMLAVDGRVINSAIHCEKVLKGAQVLLGENVARLLPEVAALEGAAQALLEKNKFLKGRFALNVIITAGAAGHGILDVEKPKPEIVIRALPAPETFPAIHAVIAQGVRRNEGSPLSRIKWANYGDNILALREATAKGANEAILLNNRGNIACASTSNIFAVMDGKLYTPPLSDGAQDGVVRGIIIQKYKALEKSLTADDLNKAEGIYLTNSVRGAVYVEKLDGKELPAPSLKIDKDLHLQ